MGLKRFVTTFGPIVVLLVSMFCAVPAGAQPVPAQRIVVSAPSAGSPTGTLTAYEQTGNGWRVVLGPTRADLGELGVGAGQDSVFRTPVGTYSLGQAFGREPNPGTRMPYFKTDDRDWWDEDVNSPTYNTHVESNEKPSSDAENLYDSGYIYDYAVLIEANAQRQPGRSAGIFLHVTNGAPTWGCVAVGREEMRRLLIWLDPAANPQITIDVGAPAPSST